MTTDSRQKLAKGSGVVFRIGLTAGQVGNLPLIGVKNRQAANLPHNDLLSCRRAVSFLSPLLLRIGIALLGLLPSSANSQIAQGPPRIRHVYIPADQLKVLFDGPSKGVLMRREKILSLWREARRRGQTEALPPADAVLAEAHYEAHLDEHQLRVSGRIRIAKLRGDWQTVDLPFGGMAIESAQLGGRAARLGLKDDGTLFLLLKEQGQAELELQMAAPLASKGGDLATTLKLPPVAASEILVRLDEGKRLQLGETALPSDGGENGLQTFRIAVGQTGLAPLLISDCSAGGNRTPLVFADSRSTVRVEPAGLRWEAVLDLDVYARATDTFQLEVPDSVEIAEVDSPQLNQWTTAEPNDGKSTLTLTFHKPVLGRRAVRLLALTPAVADEWAVPTLRLLDAAAHVGKVVVHPSPSLRVEVGDMAGIRPESLEGASASGAETGSGDPLGFAFWDENFRLPLRVTPRRRIVQASVATLVEVDRTGLELRGGVTISPRHAPLFDVEMQLPRGWEITSLLCGDQAAKWESGDTAADQRLQSVRFDLQQPLEPGKLVEISLTAHQHPRDWLEQDEGFREVPLPELRLVGADEVEGTMLVRAPPDIDLLVSDLSDDLQPVAADRSPAASVADVGTALQYHYQDDARVSGRLQVRTVAAKVSAETLAFVRLDRGKLDVHYQLDLHVRHGRIRQVGFTLPAAVGEKVQIAAVDSAARVIEQRHAPFAGDGGADGRRFLWQIVLDRSVTGDLTLAVDFSQTLSQQAAADATTKSAAQVGASVTVPVLALEGVARQSGIVAVEAAGDQQIDYRPENLRDLDPADVRKPRAYAPSQRIVAAYQYPRLPYRLTISATRHTSEPVLGAICESAEITSVAGQEGRMRHQARFRLRSHTLQQVPITLPDTADLWTVMLDGEPVEVRRQQNACIVPLPARQSDLAANARELTLLYETTSRRPAAGGFLRRLRPQTIRQAAPEIAVTTLGTTWDVYLPAEMALVSSEGNFEPVTRLTRPALVTGLAESIAVRSTTMLPWKVGGLVAAIVLAGFFAFLSSGKGCGGTLVETLVVIAVIGILIALLLPATQSEREAARRSQCTNNLKQIGLALHNYHDVHGQFPPAAIGPYDVPRQRQFSWMVAILPFLEQQPLYDKLRLDLPCDHPHNAAVLQISPSALFCPSDPSPSATLEGFLKTSYVAVTGADSTYGSGDTRGVIGFDRGLALGEIVDGAANTVMVAEVVDGGPWFAGGSGTARRIDDWIQKKTWSHHPGGGVFLLADGSVRYVATTTEPHFLRHMATAAGRDHVEDEYVDKADTKAEVATAAEAEPLGPAPESPQEKPSSRAPAQSPVPSGTGARLSLRVALETDGPEAIRFRRETGSGELVLGLQDRTFAFLLQCWMVAAAALAAWIGRRLSGPRQAMALVIALTLPVGLSGLVPLAWTPLLDGMLLGAVAAGCLWAVLRVNSSVAMSGGTSTAAALAIGASLLLTDASLADEPSSATPPPGRVEFIPPAPNKPNPANMPARPAAIADKTPDPPQSPSPNLTLFIPYDTDDGKPLQQTQVYLPHDEFLRLWKQAHPEKPEIAGPDVRAVVSHAEYTGVLQSDVARFDGRLVVHHFDDRWVSVTLPLGGVAWEKIEINGRPATLAEGGPTAIYLAEPGPQVVDVRFNVPVRRLGATGQMMVPLGAVPSGRLLFQLPADDLDVQVGGCPGGWRRQTAAPGERRAADEPRGDLVSIPLGAAGDLSIRWQPRQVEASADQLVHVDQSLLVEVLDSGVHLRSRFDYRVQQGALDKIEFRIPSELAVRRVQGAEVADWSIESDQATGADPPARRLVVSLKTELSTAAVDVDGFRHGREMTGAIDIRGPEPIGVVRETGHVAIGCAKYFRVRVDRTERLDQINHVGLELPEKPDEGCALLSAYRYTSRPWRLQLQVERLQSRVEVSDRTSVAISERQATLQSLLTAHVSGAPLRSLALRLPASLRVSQVQVPPGADWFLDGDQEGRRLKVTLNEPAIGKLDLAVNGTLVRDASQAEFDVPGVAVEEIEAHRGQLAIHLDDALEAVLVRDGGARAIDPDALADDLRPAGGGQVRYAFEYDSPPKDLRLRLSAAPSRSNGGVTTVVSVREGAVAYISNVDFEIRQAGRSRFRIATPSWLGDDVELKGEQIRQIHSQQTGGERIWQIQLQQPVRDSYRLQLMQTLPLPDDGAVQAAIVRLLDVERSQSYVVLENLTADEIAATATRGATSISINAVPEGLTDPVRRQAVAAYRIADGAAHLAWRRRVREQESGLVASINLADLTTVVHSDGRYHARAAYNIRNFTLQFLELELPAKSRVWSVHVSGQPVRPATVVRQGRPVTLLPLEKTSAGDFSSKVVLIYSGDLGAPLRLWTEVRPPAPRILSDVPVSRTLWTLLLPREYQVSLVKGESNLEAVAAAYQQQERKLSFLDEMRQMVQVASSMSGSAARSKAKYNLKQIGSALQDYAQQSAEVDARNAADVRQQSQQIELDIKRLEDLKVDAARGDGDANYYFRQQSGPAASDRTGGDAGHILEKLSELKVTGDESVVAEGAQKRPPDQAGDRAEQRGRLREQAAEQLQRLQTMPEEPGATTEKAVPQVPSPALEVKGQAVATDMPPAVEEQSGKPSSRDGQVAFITPAVGTGHLSIDLDLAFVGTAHHFRKLHGEPRLVVRARHDNLARSLTAILWGGFCLALAAVAIHGLNRPDAAAVAYRAWPWAAAILGAIWLFLLPAGVFGLALLVPAFCVLIGRRRVP